MILRNLCLYINENSALSLYIFGSSSLCEYFKTAIFQCIGSHSSCVCSNFVHCVHKINIHNQDWVIPLSFDKAKNYIISYPLPLPPLQMGSVMVCILCCSEWFGKLKWSHFIRLEMYCLISYFSHLLHL